MLNLEYAQLAGVTFVAAGIQSATGFGFGLLAAPFFLVLMNSAEAIPVVIVLTLVISLSLFSRLWTAAPKRLLMWLAAGSAAGFPLGILAFMHVSLDAIKLIVAVVILFSALQTGFRLLRKGNASAGTRPPQTRSLLSIGLTSGAMTTCIGMPGPPVMAYLAATGVQMEQIRAVMTSLAVFSYFTALVLQASIVGLAPATVQISGLLIPAALGGALAGHLMAPRISQRLFHFIVIAALLTTSLYLLSATLLK